jgi:FkbM family methyltransferase
MRSVLIKSYLKKAVVKFFSLLDVRVITNSDVSKNGLFPYVVEFFLIQSTGVLHIGAHLGQEADYYAKLDKRVLWIEADPSIFPSLKAHVSVHSNQNAKNVLVNRICDENTIFHLASNNSESSSIYELADNPLWRGLSNVGSISLPSHTLDCVLENEMVSDLDFWVLDVQGGELAVLEGAKNSLSTHCNYLQIEVSQDEFYRGGAQYSQIKNFLAKIGFFPMWEPMASHEEVIFSKINLSEEFFSGAIDSNPEDFSRDI